ncbi:MAG TPA: exodeoxyribonuclease III, partial [Opitutales bacterium]|nr:exodeoxyribonuclease III [Opitutales bacterium]
GLRAIERNGGLGSYLAQQHPAILCLQETKINPVQAEALKIPYPHQFWSNSSRPGYSGTAILCDEMPLSVTYAITGANLPEEGRVVTAEFKNYYVVCAYIPNAQEGLKRLEHRLLWDSAFRSFLNTLAKSKPVIACGDFNVAHEPIDLARPAANRQHAGFSDEERQSFSQLLGSGFIDTFRALHPNTADCYSWWSLRTDARARNVGWRLDYVLISEALRPKLQDAFILKDVLGADHAPVGVTISL